MILSFLILVFAAIFAVALLPLLFVYSGWSFVLVALGFLAAAIFLLCYVGHLQVFLTEFMKRRRHR